MRGLKYGFLAVGALSSLLGTGCARHQPDVQPQPLFDPPAAYSMSSDEQDAAPALWWQAFNDPGLDALVADSLEGNFTLAQGLARIDQSVAIRRQARSLGLPQLGLTGDVERRWTRDLDPPEPEVDTSVDVDLSPTTTTKQLDTSGGSPSGEGGGSDEPDREQWETESSLDLELSWEIDLWGRIRSLVRAEDEEVAAAALDYEALRLSLSSQVAFAYYEAIEQRLQLELLEEQLKLASTFLELLELRFVQGDASAVDLLQQRSQVAEIQSEVPVAQSQLRLLENRLDVLLGVPPDGQDRTTVAGLPEATVLPDVQVPAALLRDRPDLQAAQRRVVAQDYRIASAMAERLPQLILDGTFGLSDSSDSSLLTGTGALGLFQPLLDWGQREAQVTVEKARFQDALLNYSQRYLVAIEEVETTLWQEARQRELIASLAEREQLLTRTVEETRVRYSLGVTDYLPVITALQDLQQVQRELLEQRRELVSLRIQLFRATGGATCKESA